MKRTLSILILLLVFHSGNAQEPVADTSSVKKVTILYTNDLHSNFEPFNVSWINDTRKVGGFANIAAVVKREKEANAITYYFDAGDLFTGPNFSSLTNGEAVIDVMNLLSLDAVCIGNHEFDYGWQNMVKQFELAKYPILNGNIFLSNSENLLWNKPYIILDKGGIRVGIIGLHGKFAFYDTVADTMTHGIEARDEEFYLRKYIDELKGRVDLIVLLIHEGIPGRQSSKGSVEISRNLQKDIELAQNVSGIDILITGHTHQGTPGPLVSNGTLIVSTDALGIEVGKLELQYNVKEKKIAGYTNTLKYLYDDEIEDDIPVKQAIDKWKVKLIEITGQKTGTISQPLTRSYNEESLMGDMVSDALMYAFPGYDLALINSGGLREDITGPEVTIGEIISAYPFPNTIVQLEIKGDDLEKLLEHSASLINGVLQVSDGTIMRYTDTLPVGSRIVYCSINGKALDKNRIYKVLTNNFLAEGGDGFLAFKNAISKKSTPVEITRAMIRYMKAFEVYRPKLSGRVVRAK